MDTCRSVRSFVSLFLLGLALPVMAAMAASGGRPATVSGQIVSLSTAAQTLTVQTGDGTQAIFHVTPASHLWRNGSSVGLAGLALRDTVLTAQVDRRTLRVASLRARGPAVTTTRGGLAGLDPTLQSLSVSTPAGPRDFLLAPATLFVRNGHAATAADLTARDSLLVHALVGATAEPEAADVEADGPEAAEVEGTITAVSGGDVTITPEHGPAVTVHVNDSTLIRLHSAGGETTGTLADLKTGLKAEAGFDPVSFVALRIEAEPADGGGHGEPAHVEGTVGAVDAGAGTITINPRDGGAAVSLTTSSSTRITRNGAAATLADLKAGDRVAAEYDPATRIATRIEAESETEHEPSEIEGQVTAVSATSITIAPHSGDPVTLTLDATTVIYVNGQRAGAADVKVGDRAQAEYDAATKVAAKIAVERETNQEPAEIEGQVTAASATSVTIAPHEGSPVTLTLNSSTRIIANDKPGTAADIKVGARAQALYDRTTLVALGIRVSTGHDGHDGGGD